jgi:hypothetical protein
MNTRKLDESTISEGFIDALIGVALAGEVGLLFARHVGRCPMPSKTWLPKGRYKQAERKITLKEYLSRHSLPGVAAFTLAAIFRT